MFKRYQKKIRRTFVAKFLARIVFFFQCVSAQFVKDHGFTRATSLAYTSLFSLMPILLVGYTIFIGFPQFSEIMPKLQDVLLDNLVPEVANDVKGFAAIFMKQASELSLTGFLGLLVVAILMVFNIEEGFNHIWHVKKRRDAVSAFVLYWSVITLTPLVLAGAISLSNMVTSLPAVSEASHIAVFSTLLVGMKWSLLALFFALTYWLIPNYKVWFRDAILGGTIAMILFETTRNALVWYITKFTRYKFLYGAVAAVPIFLIWLHLVWIILLMGAQVAHMAGLFRQGRYHT